MKKFIVRLILISVLLAGCGKTTPAAPGNDNQPGNPSNPSTGGPSNGEMSSSFAPVSGTESYTISLISKFQGTISGQPVEHVKTFTQNVTGPDSSLTRMVVEGSGSGPVQVLSAKVGPAYYFQRGDGEPCDMTWQPEGEEVDAVPDLPNLLPDVSNAQKAGSETLNGLAVTRYTFTEKNLAGMKDATVQGEYWQAEGGWVVKLVMTLKGGGAYFGEGSEGEQTTTYEVSQIGSLVDLGLPAACKPPMTDLPVMDGAQNLVRHTASLSYTTASSAAEAASFYQEALAAGGWETMENPPAPSEAEQTLLFIRDLQVAQVYLFEEEGVTQVIAGISVQEPPSDPASGGAGSQTPDMRVGNAFNVLTGSEEKPSPFASYHIEVSMTQPAWDKETGQVKTEGYTLSAEAQGKDAHLIYNYAPEDPAAAVEGYVVGDQGYKLVDGQVEEDLLGVAMEWAMWPLEVVFPITIAATGIEAAGTETIDGRTAEVYNVDSAKAPAGVLEAIKGFMLVPVTSARGTIWVDQETGALLKASLTFEADVLDKETKTVQGSGPGTLEIAVSQIGQAQVKLP